MNLFELLQKHHLTVTTAESCTGGLIASNLVAIPGISSYFSQGYITYANHAKTSILGVEKSCIEQFGVVSKEVAMQMASGAAKVANADCAISSTGVAGPDGGTKSTPVGCVYLGCYVKGQIFWKRCDFEGTREEIRSHAATEAIRFLQMKIEEVIV